MKITAVETIPVDRYLFVQVRTDEGITGLGESGAWGFLEASAGAVEAFARYLIGQDPLRIEHHWQYCYRYSHFRGSAIMGALSAIDIALWDIAGKHFGVPAYQLLGGKCRDKARVYYHVFGETREELIEGCKKAKAMGFTAAGHLTPFLDESRDVPYFKTHADKMTDAIEAVGRYREAVGNDVDLCIEIHRRLTPAEAIVLGIGIEEFRPLFYEDPTLPDNFDAMALIANKIHIPIATGERLYSRRSFFELLRMGAADFLQPDVSHAGGISEVAKIASMAEAKYISISPHNPSGPVACAATLQLAGFLPNFKILEFMAVDVPYRGELTTEALDMEDGCILIPDRPGLGIELKTENFSEYPYQAAGLRHYKGTLTDIRPPESVPYYRIHGPG